MAAPIVVQTAQDDAHQLAGVLPVPAQPGRQPETQRQRETFEVFNRGFVQTIRVEIHSCADL